EKFEAIGACCNEKGNRIYDSNYEGPVNTPDKKNQNRIYCNSPEKDLDDNIGLYQSTQKELFKECNFQYVLISRKDFELNKDSLYSDINIYRYILRYSSMVERHTTDYFPKWGYFLYDRKTGEKSADYSKDPITRFFPLENLIADMNKKYGKPQ